jgi:hypothetical protein
MVSPVRIRVPPLEKYLQNSRKSKCPGSDPGHFDTILTPPSTNAFARRRAVVFFVAAGIAAVLAVTSGWWVPALPTLLGIVEAKSDLIGALADLAQIVTFVMVAIGAVLGYLGYRNLRNANAGEVARQAVPVSASKAPIRVDCRYVSRPTEGVVLDDFDPNKDPSYYFQYEGQIAYSYPYVDLVVVGQADDEDVKVAPYLAVKVNEIKLIPEKVDYVVCRYPGADAAPIYAFVATFTTERTGVFYAPQATADAVPGNSGLALVEKPADYFTLTNGELEAFQLDIFMVPGYYYRFRVGIPYTYRGGERVAWCGEEYVAGIPLNAEVWLSDWKLTDEQPQPFKRAEDLEDSREALRKWQEGPPSLRKYTRSEAAEAIERQNQEVHKYRYPYTPPQEIEEAEEC